MCLNMFFLQKKSSVTSLKSLKLHCSPSLKSQKSVNIQIYIWTKDVTFFTVKSFLNVPYRLLHIFELIFLIFQPFKGCIQHAAPHPSRQVSQEMPWTSACQDPSFLCPKDPAVHHLGNTSLGRCRYLWPVKAEENATPW